MKKKKSEILFTHFIHELDECMYKQVQQEEPVKKQQKKIKEINNKTIVWHFFNNPLFVVANVILPSKTLLGMVHEFEFVFFFLPNFAFYPFLSLFFLLSSSHPT